MWCSAAGCSAAGWLRVASRRVHVALLLLLLLWLVLPWLLARALILLRVNCRALVLSRVAPRRLGLPNVFRPDDGDRLGDGCLVVDEAGDVVVGGAQRFVPDHPGVFPASQPG